MNIIKFKIFTLLIVAAIGWLSLSFFNIRTQDSIVNKDISDLEREIKNLEDSNSSAEKFIGYLKHNSFLEKEARSKLNYKAIGEEVAFVYPDENKISSQSLNVQDQLSDPPNYLKWLYYLIGY